MNVLSINNSDEDLKENFVEVENKEDAERKVFEILQKDTTEFSDNSTKDQIQYEIIKHSVNVSNLSNLEKANNILVHPENKHLENFADDNFKQYFTVVENEHMDKNKIVVSTDLDDVFVFFENVKKLFVKQHSDNYFGTIEFK